MKNCAALIMIFLILSCGHAAVAEEGIDGYPALSEMYAEIERLQSAGAGRVEVVEYGQSVEGRPLLAIHIFRPGDTGPRPEALIAGNIHGNELIGNRMALAVAWRLAEGYGADPWITSLLEKMDFWILPCLNPDGYYHTMRLMREGDPRGQRKNMHGVDLNRNFPLPRPRKLPIPWGGSPNPESVNYHGPNPLSEPETRAMMDFLEQHSFFVSINYHSVVGVFYPARCLNHRCAARHYQVAKAFREHQPHMKYMPIRVPRWFDMFTGEMEDVQYHSLGTIAIDVELGRPQVNRRDCQCRDSFWLYNPKNLARQIENDRDATLYAIEKAYEITRGKPVPAQER